MDYKYIEQLLERYWNCETSVEEEQILRTFFRQKEVPAHLLRYKPLFAYQEVARHISLAKDFDERVLAKVEHPVVKARHIALHTRFMPLFKAAAMMTLLFTVGGVVQHTMGDGKAGVVYVYDQYSPGRHDAEVAYETDTVKVMLKSQEKPQVEKE